nr:MAG TPA: hypothetical protein [Caudoviricetes sp.]
MTTHVFEWSFLLYPYSLKVFMLKSACIDYEIELT